MSGTVPGQAWGAALSIRAKYLLQRRERFTWRSSDWRGRPRENRRWTTWKTVKYHDTATSAYAECDRLSGRGIYRYRVVYRGKPVLRPSPERGTTE